MKAIVFCAAMLAAYLAMGQDLPAAGQPVARSVYGGCQAVQGNKTGFFHTQQIDGRWWLVDPDGYGYLAIGMAGAGYYPGAVGWGFERSTPQLDRFREALLTKYPTRRHWYEAQVSRLQDWGFNLVVPDLPQSDPGTPDVTARPDGTAKWLPYALILPVVERNAESFKDVFSPAFEQKVKDVVRQQCTALKDDPRLVGYFAGNELPWAVTWDGSLLENYLALPTDAPGKKVAAEFIADRYGNSIADFNKSWDADLASFDALAQSAVAVGPAFDRIRVNADRDEFLFVLSQRYFGFVREQVRQVDPNHMLLGSRFLTGDVSLAVARGMKGNVDVVSFNAYLLHNWPGELFEQFSRAAGAPVILTEFGYRAKDNPVPLGGTGAIPRVVQSDAIRGDRYAWYVEHMQSSSWLVGCIWWWYLDGWNGTPAGNYGFVNWQDEPYAALADAARRANAAVYAGRVAGKAANAEIPVSQYTIARISPTALDGSPDKYGQLDINIDHRHAYEGYDFEQSGLSAQATLRHDGQYIYLAAKVHDTDVKRYSLTQPATRATTRPGRAPNPWALDGVEFWLGHYQGVITFDGDQLTCQALPGPFPGVEIKGGLIEGGYFIEARIPLASLVDSLKDGQLRIAIGINDGQQGLRMRQLYYPLGYEWQYQGTRAIGRLAE